MKRNCRLTPLLLGLVLLLSGCRMRIVDGVIADQFIELEQTEPQDTPQPTPEPENTPTPTPTALPEVTPKPQSPIPIIIFI